MDRVGRSATRADWSASVPSFARSVSENEEDDEAAEDGAPNVMGTSPRHS